MTPNYGHNPAFNSSSEDSSSQFLGFVCVTIDADEWLLHQDVADCLDVPRRIFPGKIVWEAL